MSGPLPPDVPRILAQLMTMRSLADYSVAVSIDHGAAKEAASRALRFLQITLPVLAERAPETKDVLPDLTALQALVEAGAATDPRA